MKYNVKVPTNVIIASVSEFLSMDERFGGGWDMSRVLSRLYKEHLSSDLLNKLNDMFEEQAIYEGTRSGVSVIPYRKCMVFQYTSKTASSFIEMQLIIYTDTISDEDLKDIKTHLNKCAEDAWDNNLEYGAEDIQRYKHNAESENDSSYTIMVHTKEPNI